MSESSSSSDEEVNERLRSAVWDVKQSQRSSKVEVKETEDTRKQSKKLPPSLRPSKSNTDFSDDVGVVQASPELKSFVAKRLTKYLDGVITEYAPDEKKTSSTECQDDFKLFSTSKYYDPADETASKINANQRNKNKRRTHDSTSDSSSDSDEDRRKLASVAVSLNDVIHAQRILSAVEETKPAEVIIANKSTNVDSKTDELSKKWTKKKKRKEEKSQLEITVDDIANNSITNDDSRHVDSELGELSKKRIKKKKRKKEKSELEISDDEKCSIPIKCHQEVNGSGEERYKHNNSNENLEERPSDQSENCKDFKESGNTSTLAVKKHKKKKKKHRSDNDL